MESLEGECGGSGLRTWNEGTGSKEGGLSEGS